MTPNMRTASAKELLQGINALLNVNALYAILIQMGLAEEVEYRSSTGSGEIKSYTRLTEAGLLYGKNKESGFSASTTMVFYESAFLSLYAAACQEASGHALSLMPVPRMDDVTKLSAGAELGETPTPESSTKKRSRSQQIPDPAALFVGWSYRIERHHWGTLGVTMRTFVKQKKPYTAWALDTPPAYGFEQGYIFYSADGTRYLQIASVNSEDFEVHTGLGGDDRRGYKISEAELVKWLEFGCSPSEDRRLYKGEGKAGAMAWLVVSPDQD
ncbi:hypothetical protein FB547_104319 [Variovorax beijingensis]|uniref:Uncharacterized protein n=1 Tax=Variovorax beijingensis TaxID=2496117 RepID=A0A561C591_9BURK|nr:hypothetical protein [Variovorax beijingensis]TWD86375.1 hypothetical protein FB547_104319 [Variovorax beijingensis]